MSSSIFWTACCRRSRRVGEYFRSELRRLAKNFEFITEVRGYGLMVGVQLNIPGKEIVNRAMEEGC